MSFVAKVFVVLNLILSAFFLMFAMYMWTAQTKWQKMYEREKTANVPEITKAQQLQRDLAIAVVRAQQKQVAAEVERDEQKRAKETLREDNLALKAQFSTKENELSLINAERQEEARENKRLVAEVEKNHKVILKLEQANAVEKNNAQAMKNMAADNEALLNQTQATLAATNRDLKTTQEDAARNSNRIAELIRRGIDVFAILNETPVIQKPMQAKVLATKPELGLVILSVGSNNEVQAGYRFTISSGGTYKGTVQVDKVYPDMSSAKIVMSPKDQNLVVATGDDATTAH